MGSNAYITKVLITGANQGLGFLIAKRLATEHKDYHVIMSGRRKDAVEDAVAKVTAEGGSAEALVLDVASDESIAQAATAVVEKHGCLDVLINNAGICEPYAESDFSRAKWLETFNVNLFGASLVTDAFMPLLEKSEAETKRIIFMTSTLGSIELKLDPSTMWRKLSYRIYPVSKAALNALAMYYAVLKEEDASWKVNVCCPGHCATHLNDFKGMEDPNMGTINACRLATAGLDGESGTFTNRHGKVPW